MPEDEGRAIILAPGEGVTVKPPVGGRLTFKVRGEETKGTLTIFETTVAPGEGPPLHMHANEDEVLYVLEGTMRFKVEDELRHAPAGSFAFIPRGAQHAWQNVGDAPARFLVILTPAGLETFFKRFAEAPDDVSGPEELFRRLGSGIGLDVVGPPLAVSDPL